MDGLILITMSRRGLLGFLGYSRLMGTDEVGTLMGLTERRAILDGFIGEHRGRIANTAGDSVLGLVEALRLSRRALEVDPRFGLVAAQAGNRHMLNVLLGYAADPQFERNEAVRLLRLALSIDDSDPEALAAAGGILAFLVDDWESGIEMADRAVALNPNSYRAWLNRGWAYKIAALPEEAVRSFDRAIRLSPVDPLLHRAFCGMGMTLIELGRFDEAIVAGKKAQRQNPSYSPAHRCLACAFAHLGRDAEAREAAARMLEFDPGFTISV